MTKRKRREKDLMSWFMPANVRAHRKHYTKEETGGYPPLPPDWHTREIIERCDGCGLKLHIVAPMGDEDERNVRAEWRKIHG